MPQVFQSNTVVIGGNDHLPVPGGKKIRDCSDSEFRNYAKRLVPDYDAHDGLDVVKQKYSDALNAVGQKGFSEAIEAWFYENSGD